MSPKNIPNQKDWWLKEETPFYRWLRMGILFVGTERLLASDETHLFRGCVGRRFPQYDILYNYGEGSYQYPLIQYKIVYGTPMIVGIGEEAIEVLDAIAGKLDSLRIGKEQVAVHELSLQLVDSKFGLSETMQEYLFATPAVLLNSRNYEHYKKCSFEQQQDLVDKAIANQILSVAKRLRYRIQGRIVAENLLEKCEVVLKGASMIGFHGAFQTNFYLPHLLSIGKGASRGYGCLLVSTPNLL